MNDLEQFRQAKNRFFGSDPHSPLTPKQKDGFTGLSYFPENTDLRLEIDLEMLDEQDTIAIQTSTGDVQEYLRWGCFRFEIDGQQAELTLYLAPEGNSYFLPFSDATSGQETYGAGRYLEVEPLPGGGFLVDFNIAYNPYCAYNQFWSCPITPQENRLNVRIEAGEKIPDGEWVRHE
ncbi:MAG: DUF1684 domain-containing protein [Anaerolineae bacterium]|nr:DUF1684 domain-containing protein [Anaerolineae bacterium]